IGEITWRELGREVREDVEIRLEGLAIIHVRRVFAGPEKGLALDSFQAFEIDIPALKKIRIFLCEIVADHGDDAGLGEIAGGKSDVSGSSSKHPGNFTVRGFDTVVRDGSNND